MRAVSYQQSAVSRERRCRRFFWLLASGFWLLATVVVAPAANFTATVDRSEVALETSYVSERRPRWFWGPIEAIVCHAFHRHILRAMRKTIELADARSGGAG